MNTITKEEHPAIFEEIGEFIVEDTMNEHRRNSNFYVQSIVRFEPGHAKYFPRIEDFSPYVGTWETNMYIRDTEYGTDWGEINTLDRVEKTEVVTTRIVWSKV